MGLRINEGEIAALTLYYLLLQKKIMKKLLLFITALLAFNALLFAQKSHYKVVFDMSSADTAAHSAVIRQVNNFLALAPDGEVEVVFHGHSLNALVKNKTTAENSINDLVHNKHVIIAACNNTMKRMQLTKDDLIEAATVVPAAILELVDKQQNGWSYIKAGN